MVGGYLIGPGAGTYLTDADLNSRNLTGVDFSGLNLLRATFEHANLTSANLTKANLTGADFTSANLTKADLDGATVSSTNFTSTVWSDTICPNGSNSNTLAHGRCFAPPASPFTAVKGPTLPGIPSTASTRWLSPAPRPRSARLARPTPIASPRPTWPPYCTGPGRHGPRSRHRCPQAQRKACGTRRA